MKVATLECWYAATQQVGRPGTSVASHMKPLSIKRSKSCASSEGRDVEGQMGRE